MSRWVIGLLLGIAGVIGVASWALMPRSAERAVRSTYPPSDSATQVLKARPAIEGAAGSTRQIVREPIARVLRSAEPGDPAADDAGSSTNAASVADFNAQPRAEAAAEPPSVAPDNVPPRARDEHEEPGVADEVKPRPPTLRHVELGPLRVWQQPGLCATGDEASQAHASLMQRFRATDADGTRLYVDPRLPAGAHLPALEYLRVAEDETRVQLALNSPRPELFIYASTELLLAAACTNADVVAYYDGALHVVVDRDDLRESAIHEYAHHALMSHGVIGPAWAQEGIAMHVARETWWRHRTWLERVADKPFSIDAMERAVPYTLQSEQATLFYAQAAAMVACAIRNTSDGLAGLVRALRAAHSEHEISYELPVPQQPSALRKCIHSLMRDGADR